MKKQAPTIAALLLTAATAAADDRTELYTRPALPSRQALERLNLKMAWYAYVSTDGRRDGLQSVHMIGDQLLVQTRSGMTTLLDANDGSTLWRAMPGKPYFVTQPPTFNERSIFALRGHSFYALDRKTGKQQWSINLPHGVSAPPRADEERVYLCLLTRELYCYELPEVTAQRRTKAESGEEKKEESPSKPETSAPYSSKGPGDKGPMDQSAGAKPPLGTEPERIWTYSAETRLELAPATIEKLIAVAGTNGAFFAVSKLTGKPQYRFTAEAPVTAPLGQYGDTAYVASQDFNVYALDIPAGRIIWRFTGGAPIRRAPQVQDEDLYVAPENAGLYRIQRDTGEEIWRQTKADRFLAANKKFVYAADRNGRMLILDRARGTQIGSYDIRDYVFPVSNEWTDRVFLAANDGLLVCLHDADYAKPLPMKKVPAKEAEPAKPESKPGLEGTEPGAKQADKPGPDEMKKKE